jgi:hypothetical protein
VSPLLALVLALVVPLASLVALMPSREDEARIARENEARRARREARALARASRPSPPRHVVRVVTYDARWDE